MEQIANELITQALRYRIDDIHLLPVNKDYIFFIRTNSGLQKMKQIDKETAQRFILYMKYQASMDVGEKRRPQSGAFAFRLDGEEIELRLSTMTNYKLEESLVIRILHTKSNQLDQSFTFFKEDFDQLLTFLTYKSGLLLFSGPVSSGKTTTIYQLLRHVVRRDTKQIITMEDPVEIEEPLFLQTEVNERAQITYEMLIKSSLRHHPDIMMIGEIRDEETAKMVIRGALTGHLMIASVHAKDCFGVISRLEELGVSLELLKQTVIAIVSQRLIARYCPICQSNCHLLCNHIPLEAKKGTIFDILTADGLRKELNRHHGNDYETASIARRPLVETTVNHPMNRKLRKAYGLGYISQNSYDQYQIY